MTVFDVENLSAADFKARRDELAKALAGVPTAELAARYVQARGDAKARDDKLAEQGKTITALQEGLELAKEKAAKLAGELTAAAKAQADTAQAAAAKAVEDAETIQRLTANLETATARAAKAENLAKGRRLALVDVMNLAGHLSAKVGPLLAAE